MKQLTRIGLLCLCLALLSGCGSKTAEPDETAAPTETPEVTETPKPENPYGIAGLTLYADGEKTNAAGDLSLRASLAYDASIDGKYISELSIYPEGSGRAVCTYYLTDALWSAYEGDGEPEWDEGEAAAIEAAGGESLIEEGASEETPPVETYYEMEYEVQPFYSNVVNLNDGTVGETVTLSDSMSGYLRTAGTNFFYLEDNGETCNLTRYNEEMAEVSTSQLSSQSWMLFDATGDWYYYQQENGIARSATDGSETTESFSPETFWVESLSDIYTAADGTVYAIADCRGENLLHYNGILRLNTEEGTCEPVWMDHTSDGGWSASVSGTLSLIRSEYGEDGMFSGQTCIIVGGDQAWQYEYSSDWYLDRCTEDYVLFVKDASVNNGTIELALYEPSSGSLLSCTALEDAEELYLSGFYPLSSTSALLEVVSWEGEQLFYCWDWSGYDGTLDEITVSAVSTDPVVPDLTGLYDVEEFTPGDCLPELADQRAYADELEQKYGVRFLISNESRGIYGGYAIYALNDADTVQTVLEQLDQELAKYPDGFFEQFKTDWYDGILISVAGIMEGVTGDGLDYAGGLRTDDITGYNGIILDCTDPNYATSLHHEISHAIEQKLIETDWSILDSEEWLSLNPTDFYLYSYLDYQSNDAALPYIFSYDDYEDTYLIDFYSATYPGEDRARLFEYAMTDDSWFDLNSYPHLKEKLDYYAACIREGFDTTGWPEQTCWEQ